MNLPVARFTATVNKMQITFNAVTSLSPLGSITKFKWNFGDETVAETETPTYTHTYTTSGQKTVTLEVEDSLDLTDSVTLTVEPIANVAPISDFTFDVSGRTVTVTSVSTDSDGSINEYQWNFGESETNGTDAATTTHTYESSGVFTVRLTVIDNDG